RRVLQKILPKLLVKNYAFDIEMLSVAHRKGFTRIYEAPIKLKHRFGSVTDAAALNTIWHMLYDTLAVFYRLKILKYYD
ncbi:glycosyltransferase family 2 protein, partial [Patescibacteria group bacterium]|nr:glycosyltransferase family 2 protein [Patescibacteria group bacterium]